MPHLVWMPGTKSIILRISRKKVSTSKKVADTIWMHQFGGCPGPQPHRPSPLHAAGQSVNALHSNCTARHSFHILRDFCDLPWSQLLKYIRFQCAMISVGFAKNCRRDKNLILNSSYRCHLESFFNRRPTDLCFFRRGKERLIRNYWFEYLRLRNDRS